VDKERGSKCKEFIKLKLYNYELRKLEITKRVGRLYKNKL
jgi:hypothetical protein